MMNIADRKHATARTTRKAGSTPSAAALQAQDAAAAAALFLPDGLWRDVLAFTWNIQTMAGRAAIEAVLRADAGAHQAGEFPHPAAAHAAALGQPRRHRGDRDDLRVRDRVRPRPRHRAAGARQRKPTCAPGRWSRICTSCAATRKSSSGARRRMRRATSAPTIGSTAATRRAPMPIAIRPCIVVGGGQAGLSIAARLRQLGVDTLIIDRHERIGDNWRKRYHSLTLHNEVHVNHLPYMPFPPTFPGLHPERQAGELVRGLRRKPGAEFLDRHGARRRQL